MYFAGVPTHDQVIVPVLVLYVGVTVTVTAWPTLLEAVLPVTVTVPPSSTEAVATLPDIGMVTPPPAHTVLLGSL